MIRVLTYPKVKTTGARKVSCTNWDEIKSQLDSDLVKNNGFILDGFPRTRKGKFQILDVPCLFIPLSFIINPYNISV